MTTVTIPFGGSPLSFDVPGKNLAQVLVPNRSTPVADLDAAVEAALAAPIGQPPIDAIVKASDRVLIVSDDNTRLTPSDRLIPPLLRRLNRAGVPDRNIRCIMALGTHRYMTAPEMEDKVGAEVFGRIRVFNHEWRESANLVDLGRSAYGTPLLVNRAVAEADVVIGLGAIVPHHIPGFSGSSKIIQPGICGPRTTAETHLLSCEGGGDSFLGIEDNPVRRDMDDMAERVGMRTILNVVMDPEGRVTGIFHGARQAAFQRGVQAALVHLRGRVPRNPGHRGGQLLPLRPRLLAVAQVPVPGPAHGAARRHHRRLHAGAGGGEPGAHRAARVHGLALRGEIKAAYRDGRLKNGVAAALAIAWAMVREKASVITYSPGIPEADKAKLGHTHAPDVQWAVAEALRRQGSGARVAVLPNAPDLLPIRV